jgi:hypothetical protein
MLIADRVFSVEGGCVWATEEGGRFPRTRGRVGTRRRAETCLLMAVDTGYSTSNSRDTGTPVHIYMGHATRLARRVRELGRACRSDRRLVRSYK